MWTRFWSAPAEIIKQNKRRENLIELRRSGAGVSRDLVTLKHRCAGRTAPVAGRSRFSRIGRTPSLSLFLKAMEFNTLTKRIADALEAEAAYAMLPPVTWADTVTKGGKDGATVPQPTVPMLDVAVGR